MFGFSNRECLLSILCIMYIQYFFLFSYMIFCIQQWCTSSYLVFFLCRSTNAYVYVDLVIHQSSSLIFELLNSTMVHALHSPAVLAQLWYCACPWTSNWIVAYPSFCPVLLDRKTSKLDIHSVELICNIQWLKVDVYELLKKNTRRLNYRNTDLLNYWKLQMIERAH